MVFMNCMKNSLASIFKWLVAWKLGIPRPKVSCECSSPSPTLSYTTTKKKSRVFCDAKAIEGTEAPGGTLRFLFRFHGDRILFSFLSDRVLFRVLSDRVLLIVLSDRVIFESPVIGSFSGFSLIDSYLGSSLLSFLHTSIFYRNTLLLFIKNGWSVLRYIFK